MKCNILVFASAFLLAGSFVNAQDETTQAPPPQCSPLVAIDCNYYDVNFVWAFDNDTCFAFVNRCVFDVANCDKYLSGQPLLEETTQEECQPKCSDCRNAAPGFIELCAQSDGKVRYFNNKCEIDRIICETAEMWYLASNTVCEVSVSAIQSTETTEAAVTEATTTESTESDTTVATPPNCDPYVIYDCALTFDETQYVWTINPDTGNCVYFVNRCNFDNANCNRFQNGQIIYEEIDFDETICSVN